MLYRFSGAATAAQVNADIASVRAALPPDRCSARSPI